MSEVLSVEEGERAVRELLDERVQIIRDVLEVAARRNELREQLEDAEKELGREYQRALRHGWTADDLKRVGVTPPAAKPARRAKQNGRTGARSEPRA